MPIRLDIELEEQRYKDAFTWNPTDPDSEITIFAKRTVKDLKLPPPFIMHIVQSIQVLPSSSSLFFLSPLIDKSISMHLRLPLIYLYCYCYYYLDQTQLAEFRSYEGQDMLYTGDKIVPIKVFLSCTEYCSLSYCSILFRLLAIIWKDFALFLRSQLDLRVNNTLIKDQFLWVR